uniref:Methyltransf_25 domain-containing protein n=1 Tax=Macrostomum lignano TaxID=282301 RepID=A0A1I8F9A3_9PLAT
PNQDLPDLAAKCKEASPPIPLTPGDHVQLVLRCRTGRFGGAGQQVLELGWRFAPLLEFYCDTVGPSGGVTLVDPEPRLAERLAAAAREPPNARFADLASVLPAGGAFDLAVMANVYHPPGRHRHRPGRRPLGSASWRPPGDPGLHPRHPAAVSPREAANPPPWPSRRVSPTSCGPPPRPSPPAAAPRSRRRGFEVRLRTPSCCTTGFASPLGDFYVDAYVKHSLHELASLGRITKEEVAELLGQGLPTLQQGDPEAELFSNINPPGGGRASDIVRREFELKQDRMIKFLKKAGLAEGQQVLELGCGFAPLLEFYCDTVGPYGGVTLVDPEPRLAERLAPRLAGRPNACFAVSSAEDRLRSPLGDFYVDIPQVLLGLGDGGVGSDRLERPAREFAALRDEDSEAVIFGDVQVLLAADRAAVTAPACNGTG